MRLEVFPSPLLTAGPGAHKPRQFALPPIKHDPDTHLLAGCVVRLVVIRCDAEAASADLFETALECECDANTAKHDYAP